LATGSYQRNTAWRLVADVESCSAFVFQKRRESIDALVLFKRREIDLGPHGLHTRQHDLPKLAFVDLGKHGSENRMRGLDTVPDIAEDVCRDRSTGRPVHLRDERSCPRGGHRVQNHYLLERRQAVDVFDAVRTVSSE